MIYLCVIIFSLCDVEDKDIPVVSLKLRQYEMVRMEWGLRWVDLPVYDQVPLV